jgi:hypothetical protein
MYFQQKAETQRSEEIFTTSAAVYPSWLIIGSKATFSSLIFIIVVVVVVSMGIPGS